LVCAAVVAVGAADDCLAGRARRRLLSASPVGQKTPAQWQQQQQQRAVSGGVGLHDHREDNSRDGGSGNGGDGSSTTGGGGGGSAGDGGPGHSTGRRQFRHWRAANDAGLGLGPHVSAALASNG
jgi:hypothetical protein